MAAVTITIEANFSGSTWTDISSYLESEVSITGGRQDELSQADANQCSFMLDNRDGRFTPGKTTGAYYPNVKVGVPIRVTAAIGTASSRRFTGYVDSWRLDWSDGDGAAKVEVQASSIMSRLGLLSERKSAIEEEVLLDSPAAYYPLSEPAGATAASDRSGNSNGTLYSIGDGASFTFAYPVTGAAEGVQAGPKFSGGKYLQADLSPSPSVGTLEAFFLQDTSVSFTSAISFASGVSTALAVNGTTGAVRAVGGGSTLDAGPNVFDGRIHHAALTLAGGTLTLYVDGIAVGSTPAGAPAVETALAVGGLFGAGFTGVVAHVAAYSTALSAARISAHYAAGINAFQGESVAARLARYASWVKLTSYSASSTTPVAADAYIGASVVDLMHNLETTENGVLYDERDGTLTLKARRTRNVAATEISFDATAQQLESAFSPVTDRQGLANDVTVTTSGGTTVNLVDTSSQTSYGVARTSVDTLATEAQDPLARAQWEIAAHSQPRERVPTLGVDVLNCGLSVTTLLGLTVGSRVGVTNPPSQAAGVGDYFVEGWSETFDPTSYVTTFNVSPAQPWVNTLILDDPTKGVLDSTYVLAY